MGLGMENWTEEIYVRSYSIPKTITISNGYNINVRQYGIELLEKFGKNINMDDSQSADAMDFVREKFQKYNLRFHKYEFGHPTKLFGKGETGIGTNFYSILPGRRNIANECWVLTFNRRNVYEIITVLTVLETLSLSDRPIPLDVMFVGLDGRFKRFGIGADNFLKHFRSNQRQTDRCSLVRKGMNIEALFGGNESVLTLSPYGINSNMADLDYIQATIRSQILLNKNGFKTKMRLVEENQNFSLQVKNKLNDYIYNPLSSAFPEFFQPLKSHLTFSSLKKAIIGNPNEAHSHLLDNGIKAYTIRLSLSRENLKV